MPAVTAALGRSGGVTVEDFFSLIDPTRHLERSRAARRDCPLPVLVKGVQTGEDAALACEHGAAGVVVSNHGGRQLDTVARDGRDAARGRRRGRRALEVLVDGGIRRGTDVLVALALGARAVLVGRPALWGLAPAARRARATSSSCCATRSRAGSRSLGCASPRRVVSARTSAAIDA